MRATMTGEVVTEVYDDHEVFHPPRRLDKALSTSGRAASMDLGAIARAEKALAALAVEFAAWMKNEIKVLDAARDFLRERGVTEDTHAALFRAAHDIKGEAATFGYPIAGMIAGSLCRLMDEIGDIAALPLLVVDQHVDAIRAIVRQEVKGDTDETALALARRLDELVTRTLGEAVSGSDGDVSPRG
jgi:chemotaxis protein histidine kinase CheA